MYIPYSLAVLIVALSRAASGQDVSAQASASCGRTSYSARDVSAASQAACQLVKDEQTAGSSNYPHRFNNFEAFHFHDVQGPYYEFPMLSSGRVYRGGRPGPDRVIVTRDCQQAGQITHTGAGGNNFVGCSGTD
ncbi:hypothetical protein CDD80_3980 [Ophiocordyceps camponoti-rufipedis]|uniref:ribonuclease T1 n=1 Tax=Ophiocordyceps camponoti-rufipedis TaxID=2004952 RepID=A0A2C5YWS5_9HYPO|nr:hypothetical protein CDD80_3980 [Ophiocordyceps camponoti-rufipedis]